MSLTPLVEPLLVCQTNKACSALVLRDPSTGLLRDEPADDSEAVCYKEGYAVKEMFQVCDVTSESDLLFIEVGFGGG